ncbi:MAG: D-alanyl-D-alanine carboxypeptidase/D-alanyl-D-alanine-endopeptidase [Gemmatimonadota bacterium]|nr:D-alanyl-D-alanine carboxypeptidase/D-alanyl-D-alanine-endopeptidase [Gemmatimonadota bacterium]
MATAQESGASTGEATVGSSATPKVSADQTRSKRRTPQKRGRVSRRRTPTSRAIAPAPRHTTPRGLPALTSDLGTMLGSRVRNGTWGVIVVSLTRGDTLYSYNADASLQPASNMKLYTAAVALEQFGPAHQFSTDVLRDGESAADGTLNGNLVLRGDGDPSLSSRFFDNKPDAPMQLLAQRVFDTGIRRVNGDLIADGTAFDAQRIPDGWLSRYLHASYAARVSALSLNENLAWVVVEPGATKAPAVIRLEPAGDLPITNKIRTVAGSGARIAIFPTPNGGFEVRGWIGSRAGPQRYQVVVDDPAAFTASAFRNALARRGIVISGNVRFEATPAGSARVTALPSAPLTRMLSVMNRESVNHFAELIFRNAARDALMDQGRAAEPGLGSTETANALLQRFMTEKVGAQPGAVHAADGSGLSVLDRASPRSLVQLLSHAHKADWADAFHASLPVAGQSEMLRNRMRYTPAQGNLHAKTGTTNSVISLGGYVTAQDGELLAFAFIYNGRDRWNAKSTIDQMGATLAGFVR